MSQHQVSTSVLCCQGLWRTEYIKGYLDHMMYLKTKLYSNVCSKLLSEQGMGSHRQVVEDPLY